MPSNATAIAAQLHLAVDAGSIVVHSVRGDEQVSRAFRYEVDFACKELDLDAVRGTLAEVVLTGAEGLERSIHGLIDEVEVVGTVASGQSLVDVYRHRLVLVPLHTTLAFNHGFRLFQGATALEICQQVFRDAGIPDEALSVRVRGALPKRELCIQYDESEWDFVCRLLESEGIWFTFEHGPGAHVMVLAEDSKTAARATPGELVMGFGGPLGGETKVTEISFVHSASISSAAIKDTDPLQPSRDLFAKQDAGLPLGREHYEFPSGVLDPSRTKEMAQRCLDALSWRRQLLHARTNAFAVESGRLVTMTGHPDLGQDYFVVRIHTDLRFVSPAEDDGAAGADCVVDLVLMPATHVFRPERVTPRPRVIGMQTARVTGPAGAEIHTDPEGRIKVQFHWDREGQLDEKSSCWVRVSQAHTTGSFMVPRVGWEVLIEHEEGDPDRPLCLGRVYNPFFPSPFALPAQKTVSAHRSYSSPGGGGVNEISVDDAGGAELVKVFGQMDVNVLAANHRKRTVARHETSSVGVNRTLQVGADETLSVGANLSESVAAEQTIHVGGNRQIRVGGALAEEVTGAVTTSIGSLAFLHAGNTAQAVVDSVLSDAASACESAAAGLLSPLQGYLDQAKQALGDLAAKGGAFGAAVGMAVDVAVDAVVDAAVTVAVGSVGGGSGGDAASASAPAGSAGNGSWATEVGANVTESVGGMVLFASLKGLAIGVGGDSSESIAAARVEKVGGGKAETTTDGKVETVGSYKVEASEGIKIDVGGAAKITVAGALEQDVDGSHALVAGKKALLKTKTLDLDASSSIAFQCGLAKLIIDGSGVSLQGLQVTLEGDEIQLKPAAIKPG